MGLQGERLGADHLIDDEIVVKATSDEKVLSGESTGVSASGSEGKVLSGDTPSTSVSEDKHLSGETTGSSYLSAETNTRYSTASAHSGRASPDEAASGHPSDITVGTKESPEHSAVDPRNSNLDFFHGEARFEQEISEGQFTKIKGLSECCRADGKVELHRWSKTSCEETSWAHATGSGDRTVVVKRVLCSRVGFNVGKERNERIVSRGHSARHAEDCLTEIGVYCYLARQTDLPQFILKMHTVFQSSSDVWLVLEHANSGDLFAVVQKLKREGTSLSMNHLMTWMWQLLQAVFYLHQHRIGHRDISMENVLLCNGIVRLMDFGQAVQTHTSGGVPIRYFNALGKPYYRPPECHVPAAKTVQVHVPKDAQPGELTFAPTTAGDCICDVRLPASAVPGQPCSAEPWGYVVPPVDIFACGVCLFIMATGMPPWRNANLSDPHFTWVHQCGISQLLKHWKKPLPEAADELLTAMVRSVPSRRPSAQQCLSHRWFEPMRGTDLPIHAATASASRRPASASQRSGPAGVADNAPSPHAAAATLVSSVSAEAPGEFMEGSSSGVSAVECLATVGDPYTKPLAVRSVAAPASKMATPVSSSSPFGGKLVGDFYSMPEELYRSSECVPEELILTRFSGSDLPPNIPTDESFELEPTTFNVTGKEPAKLGNHLINFLSMAAGAVVTKINTKKWTVKAEVDDESGTCRFKIRIYRQGEGSYAIEFQRRAGETTALHRVFDQAVEQMAPSKPSPRKGRDSATASQMEQRDKKDDASSAPASSGSSVPALGPGQRSPKAPRRSVPARISRPHTGAQRPSNPFAPEDLPERPASEPANLAAGSGLNAVRSRSKASTRCASSSRMASAVRLNATA
jgi:serine/threonine protein kinase